MKRKSAKTRIVGWFSCGNNSAVMSKLLVQKFGKSKDHELRIVRCRVINEHQDNDRFSDDVQKWIDYPIEIVMNEKYAGDADRVWRERRYMAGINGAVCTIELKKVPRWELESAWHPDYQAYGFSFDEKGRADQFEEFNPETRLIRILEERKITKQMCAIMVSGAGIELPVLYRMGFRNNNCIGCVKA